jgi:aspartyl-tRNA(Asn)/glutamyl-tRNA(Gln) amidotransferase subunit B
MATHFEQTAKISCQPKLASNWIMGEFSRRVNAGEGTFEQPRVSAALLAALIMRIAEGKISNNAGKQIFEALWAWDHNEREAHSIRAKGNEEHIKKTQFIVPTSSIEPGEMSVEHKVDKGITKPQFRYVELIEEEVKVIDQIIEEKGLQQMNDAGALEKIVDDVIAANPDNVAQFRAGKDKAFNALVGQVMKASKGRANPQQVNALLKARLG